MTPLKISLPLLLSLALGPALAAAQAPDPAPETATVKASTGDPSSARIVYTFSHPQLQPAEYTITVEESGDGHFVSKPGTQGIDPNDDVYPAPIDRKIRLDESLRSELFAWARAHGYFGTQCARTQGKLAFTGNKTLSYAGADGHGSCQFVWAADPALQRISDQLQAVALTLEIGRRLDVEVRHDRLGLDAELQSLQDAVQAQRASGLPNIADELKAIADDTQVMNRARKRAEALLSRCEAPQKPN